MSKIVIKLISKAEFSSKYIYNLHKITGLSISAIESKVLKNEIVFEFLVFNNDHDEIASTIFQIIESAKENNINIEFYELTESDDFYTHNDLEKRKISEDVLKRILKDDSDDVASDSF